LGAPSGFQLQSSAAPSLAPARDTRKENKQKKHLEILYPSINIDIAKIFSKGICKRHLSKWQVVPTREFIYPKFSQMFPKTVFSGNIFFLISGEC